MAETTQPISESSAILRREKWLVDEFDRPYNVVGVTYLKTSKRGKTLLAYRLEVIVFADEVAADGSFKIVRSKSKNNRSIPRDKAGNPSPAKPRPSP